MLDGMEMVQITPFRTTLLSSSLLKALLNPNQPVNLFSFCFWQQWSTSIFLNCKQFVRKCDQLWIHDACV